MDVNAVTQAAVATLVAVGWKIAGAAALWLVGRWLIHFAMRALGRVLSNQRVDATLTRYLLTGLTVVLNIALVVAILGFFGVETTTFAALIAAGGVAIGVAWGGLLSNFAAGAFLVFLRPFKVGDFVSAGGVTGTVEAIGLFGTTINTPDNVHTIVGNNKIFSDTIQNFSANAYRRVDLSVTINNAVEHRGRDSDSEGAAVEDPERARSAGARRGCAPVHSGRPSALRASLLQQRPLLAGVLRREPHDSRGLRRGEVPGAGAGVRVQRTVAGSAAGSLRSRRGPRVSLPAQS